MAGKSAAGKGDTPRRVDGNVYRKNYDAIKWGPKWVCTKRWPLRQLPDGSLMGGAIYERASASKQRRSRAGKGRSGRCNPPKSAGSA